MSKKTELATQQGGALAERSQFARDYHMEGEDSGDALMPRVILHQGDIAERIYGSHPKGTLLNSVSREVIEARNFTPLGIAWKEFIRFGDDRDGTIIYRTRDKNEVPPEDLQWNPDQTLPIKERAPKCTTFYNFLILFDGVDEPICLTFKSSMKGPRKTALAFNQMEKIRSGRGLSPGYYELQVVDESNDRGKWKELRTRPNGNPPEALEAAAFQFYQKFSGRDLDVHLDKAGDTDDGYDPEKDE